MIITNSFDLHHFNQHLIPFINELNIKIKYGINIYKNILIWIYSVNSETPHTAFESKSLFSAIDYISKQFKNYNTNKNYSSIDFQGFGIFCNELWNDLYNPKLICNSKNKKNCYIIDCKKPLLDESSCSSFYNYKIKINSEDAINNYSCFRINKLEANTINTILIRKNFIKSCNFIDYNVSIYNNKIKKDLKLFTFSIYSDAVINFILFDDYKDISIYIYSGLRGNTINNFFDIETVNHFFCQLNK